MLCFLERKEEKRGRKKDLLLKFILIRFDDKRNGDPKREERVPSSPSTKGKSFSSA